MIKRELIVPGMQYYREGFSDNETRTVLEIRGTTVYYGTERVPNGEVRMANSIIVMSDREQEFHLVSPAKVIIEYSIF